MDDYVIIEEMTIGEDASKEEFVICGYPASSKMRTYLNLLKDEKIKSQINAIHTKHKTEFAQLFADMHNFVNTETILNAENQNIPNPKYISTLDELYKFSKVATYDNITNWFKQWTVDYIYINIFKISIRRCKRIL